MKMILALICSCSVVMAQVPMDFGALADPRTEVPSLDSLMMEPQVGFPAFEVKSKKSVLMAVSLSSLFPGLGHLYLGEYNTASGLIGTTVLESGIVGYPEGSQSVQNNFRITLQNTWSYGIYAAYRDARIYNGMGGYSYRMPTDSFRDLSLAPFRPSILKKPEVWGGLIAALGVGIGVSYMAFPHEARIRLASASSVSSVSPLTAFPIGIGEEAIFRGFLQSQLCELTNPWVGISLSSLIFGAMHIPNARELEPEDRWRYYAAGLPVITSLGAYFGWLAHKNHSLQESVALHAWYDFTLFALSSLATQAAIGGHAQFAFSTDF